MTAFASGFIGMVLFMAIVIGAILLVAHAVCPRPQRRHPVLSHQGRKLG